MLSSELEVTLHQAFQDARDRRHEFMTVEHLLLALLDNDSALQVLNACAADVAFTGDCGDLGCPGRCLQPASWVHRQAYSFDGWWLW